MENLFNSITEILILLFLMITFLQSGIDKITDWKGNVSWLKDHFSQTYLKNVIPISLAKLLILEVIIGVLCIVGIYKIIAENNTTYALYATILSCIVLLALLFGQRIAKDYDGARTIVIYFMPAIFGVYLLSN